MGKHIFDRMKYNSAISKHRNKNRKASALASLKKRRRMMSSPVSSELKRKYSVKTIPICSGDEVQIMSRGFKGRKGKVTDIKLKKGIVHVEHITVETVGGKTAKVGIHPSN